MLLRGGRPVLSEKQESRFARPVPHYGDRRRQSSQCRDQTLPVPFLQDTFSVTFRCPGCRICLTERGRTLYDALHQKEGRDA